MLSEDQVRVHCRMVWVSTTSKEWNDLAMLKIDIPLVITLYNLKFRILSTKSVYKLKILCTYLLSKPEGLSL